jgi:hypothetical protein
VVQVQRCPGSLRFGDFDEGLEVARIFALAPDGGQSASPPPRALPSPSWSAKALSEGIDTQGSPVDGTGRIAVPARTGPGGSTKGSGETGGGGAYDFQARATAFIFARVLDNKLHGVQR